MNISKSYGLLILFWLIGFFAFSQQREIDNSASNISTVFTIRGSVYEKESYKPYKNVEILVNGGQYTRTFADGTFNIKAKIGDELIISHDDFETIYYTVTSNERITIEVIDAKQNGRRSKITSNFKRFNEMIDSADVYLKTDAEKSIKFIGDALNVDSSAEQNAQAYELLGDVYMYWKQYDLAISAFKTSIQNTEKISAKLKLAKAYRNEGNYDKSLKEYTSIDEKKLSNYEKTVWFEGIGDTYVKLKDFSKAIKAYQDGLKVANKHLIAPKVTDLNSKMAQVYSDQGQTSKAKVLFNNSLNLAKNENKKRAVEEQVKVAEFNSLNADYDDEIVLRKEAIEAIKDIEKDSIIANESPITIQKQNYKIGNAYYLQNDMESAIPYYEKSIEEADKKEDLDVKMDATRKLSEAHLRAGNTEKAIAYSEAYNNVVDQQYAKKIQEISQAARFSRNIAEQQNRITSLESDRALSRSKYELTQEQNKNQKIIIYSLIGGLILLLITGYLMFKYIKQQRLANNLLALKSLRSQMNPHFIFNALNSVNTFIATNDERTANKYLTDFSKLMRAVLENSEEDFIPLKKEVELLNLYTQLEHFRFQDKFDYSIDVDESIDVDDYQIPPMLLQPYIENAVWHGLRYKNEKGHLHIYIQPKSKDEITITIADNGIGRERSKALKTDHQKKQNSKGMNNIKKRVSILNEMYKDKVDVTISDFQESEDAGTKVVVTLKKD
ncbi:tetratricopeptide repeat-containing sensor histidine kinase [Winogradskyella endarachnes]|uniref:Tetratricopeptide repeat protein n=1 Tax=Winogradskyella endarachnes TaxID=2681965 RepID=A0A6L6U9Z7_9FLAO|nr:histidine kinase [Winogradskyella endarachnes]MUU77747.1 tetratricopeptide repeat protein [Winogradskyella endarachnes]